MVKKIISNTLVVTTIEDAIDAFVVDLNNQMTSAQLDAEGHLLSALSTSFNVRAYYGATPVISECSVSAATDNASVTASYNSTTHNVTVSANGGAVLSATTTVTVTVSHISHGTRAVTFTIAGTKNSAVYELVPSIDTVSFARTNAGGLTPASRTITLNVQKTEAGVTSTRNIGGFANLTCRWDIASAPATASDGYYWGSSPSPAISGITWTSGTPSMIVANSLDATNIYVSIFKDGVLLDTETIPVVKDGSRVRDVSIFEWLDDKPDTPTSTDIPPSDWALTSGRPANVSVGTTWKIENVDDEQKKLVHVVFFTTKPNAKLVLRGTAYSEEGYDFLVLGYLDDNALYTTAADTIQADCENGNTTYGESVSGDGQSIAKTYTIASEGRHSIYLCFVKDGSAGEHGDYGIVESIETDGIQLYSRLWRCIGSVKDDDTTITGTWSNPVLVSGLDGEDGENGISAPYYFQEWFAWSDTPSTSDVDTSPFKEPYNGWQESIPTQDATYLWRKSVRYVLNASTNTYSADNPQYFRMSGTNGTSINIKNNISRAYQYGYNGYPQGDWSVGDKCISNTVIDSKPKNSLWEYRNVSQGINAWVDYATASDGDAFTINHGNLNGSYQSSDVLAGHLVQWSQEANAWLDLGQFKGESGVTYYTHIAWATSVTLSQSELPIPSGQTNRPNALAANISGFSITPLSGVSYAWMGYLIDTNSSDSQVKQNYTWQRNKGEKGDDASEVNPNILLRTIFDDGIDKVKEAWSSDWTVTSIDAATDTIVEGRKSLRINMANGQTGDCDLFQVIFGKLKASTWYTVSFNYFATHAWNTFLHSNVESYPAYYDASAGIIIDGVMQAMSGNNGTWQWPADWTGQRHTMTFKTASDLSGIWDNSQLLFRVPQGCQLALCMPKLEIGQVATAYMANEDDLKGDQGDRGKVGRFFYFAGTFNPQDDDPTHVFVVNDAQAPYFEHTENEQKRYHVFNYETNGSYTMAQMWAISSQSWNNAPWEVMTNDFKYIITQALFGEYARLGSWIFNSDFMMSEKGTGGNGADGTRGTALFNGIGSSTGFKPNIVMDAFNGQASFGCDKIRFNADGGGFLANGNISWDVNGKTTFKGSIVNSDSVHLNEITIDTTPKISFNSAISVTESGGVYTPTTTDPSNYFESILIHPEYDDVVISTKSGNIDLGIVASGMIHLKSNFDNAGSGADFSLKITPLSLVFDNNKIYRSGTLVYENSSSFDRDGVTIVRKIYGATNTETTGRLTNFGLVSERTYRNNNATFAQVRGYYNSDRFGIFIRKYNSDIYYDNQEAHIICSFGETADFEVRTSTITSTVENKKFYKIYGAIDFRGKYFDANDGSIDENSIGGIAIGGNYFHITQSDCQGATNDVVFDVKEKFGNYIPTGTLMVITTEDLGNYSNDRYISLNGKYVTTTLASTISDSRITLFSGMKYILIYNAEFTYTVSGQSKQGIWIVLSDR